MSNDCERTRDAIAGWVTGAPRDDELLQKHLDSCAACRDYLRALREEDALLTDHFAAADTDTARRLERLRLAIGRMDTSEQTNRVSIWRGIMRSGLSKTAIAAAILLAAAVGITQLGGRLDGAAVAWADVARKLDGIYDFTYRQREIQSSGVRTPGYEFQNEYATWCYYSTEFGSRWDQFHSDRLIGQYYTLVKQRQWVGIHTAGKTFSRHAEPMPETMPLDPVGEIRPILAEPHVSLGRTTINGVLVEGIEVQGQKVLNGPALENAVSRLWVDVKTELPVWMESEGKILGREMYARLIRDQFRCNTGLTEADFTPVIPPDFTEEDRSAENGTERSDVAVASAKEPVEVDFSPLHELGLLSEDPTPEQPTIPLTGIKEIRAAQREVMSAWPRYADLRDALRLELDQKLNLDALPVAELVRYGVLLREKYWDVGGDLSPVSYRYGYMARVLLETAYAREPNDLAVGDELAEAIMAVEMMGVGDDFWPVLTELRTTQFHQARAEVASGRRPVWEDFARGCDLMTLCSFGRDPDKGDQVGAWLIANAEAGGWTAYRDLLEQIRSEVARNSGLGYNIHAPGDYPEEFRYGGRLPSFRGPAKRAVVPSHPLRPRGSQAED